MIATKYITQMVEYNSFESFKYDLRICMINKMCHESQYVKLRKGTFWLWFYIQLAHLFYWNTRIKYLEKKIWNKINIHDYIEFENIYNNYEVFAKYRSYKKHYDNCGPPFPTLFKFIHTEGNEDSHIIEYINSISYRSFNNYAAEHSNKFISSIIYKYAIKGFFK